MKYFIKKGVNTKPNVMTPVVPSDIWFICGQDDLNRCFIVHFFGDYTEARKWFKKQELNQFTWSEASSINDNKFVNFAWNVQF
jgi:hypothetical protein